MEKNVPALRFKGFTDAWWQRGWTETVDISTNMVDPKTGEYDELTHIGPGNIESFTGQLLSNIKTVKEEKLISGKFHFKKGDIVYGKINPQLAKYILSDFEGLCSADAYVLNAKNDLEQSFLFRILQSKSFYGYSVSVSQRTGMPKINRDELNQYNFNAPTLPEQTAIGTFFRTLDDIIAATKRKLDELKKLKKAYLQQMFPQAGERVPRVRFEGFSGDWKIKKLDEIADVVMGQSPDSENYTDNSNDHILVQGNADMKNGRVVPRVWTTQITKTANRGDLIISVRAPVGDVGKTDYDIVLGRGVAAVKGNEFILQTLTRMKLFGYWDRVSSGSTFESINSSDLKDAEILCPTLSEQAVIGNFFLKLDEQIETQAKKINNFKKLKQAYLQKMFV